jgi:hypothetical protein
MNLVKIENVVLCEGVRYEVGGKHTLYGVFSPELDMSEFPGFILIASWISISIQEAKEFSGLFRVRDDAKKVLSQANFKFGMTRLGMPSIVIGPVPLHIDKPGIITFDWKIEGQNWQKIIALTINRPQQTAF